MNLMKIAYLTAYLGKEFMTKYREMVRNLLFLVHSSRWVLPAACGQAGHDVTIYSSGVTTCGVK